MENNQWVRYTVEYRCPFSFLDTGWSEWTSNGHEFRTLANAVGSMEYYSSKPGHKDFQYRVVKLIKEAIDV